MITVTRLDGSPLVVNADLITTIESTPDTVLALVTGLRIMVRESVPEVVARAVAYRRSLAVGPLEVRGGGGQGQGPGQGQGKEE